MKLNPYISALLAVSYIILVVLVIFYVGNVLRPQETILVPMAMLSLFVLSAAVMGFLFVYQPFRMYIDGEKKHALVYFGKMVATMAVCAVIFLIGVIIAG